MKLNLLEYANVLDSILVDNVYSEYVTYGFNGHSTRFLLFWKIINFGNQGITVLGFNKKDGYLPWF